MYKVILFDMDGVIVDSMPYHFISWYEALRSYGVRVSCFDVYAKEGERWDKSLIDFLRKAGIKPTKSLAKEIFIYRQKIFKKYFKRFIFHGVYEFLCCLKTKGYSLGLVTGTPMPEVVKILPKKIRVLFDCMVTGEKLKHGKPHPEPYLRAAKLLGLSPKECCVVENAPLGIRSAKKAGMFCFAVSTSLPASYLKEADYIAGSLEEIPVHIEKSCGIRNNR
jgi:beta-phosphoglucomutase